jgi:hypothetical protein
MNTLYHFSAEDALKYGSSDAAAILYVFRKWLRENVSDRRYYKYGRVWFQARHDIIARRFPWLNERQIRHRVKKLTDSGTLLKGVFNQDPFDQTRWYTLDEDEFIIDPSNPFLQNPTKEFNL